MTHEPPASPGPARTRGVTIAVVVLVVVSLVAVFLVATANRGRARVEADGAFHGTAAQVRSDSLRLTTDSGTIRVDTWAVCGDRTRAHVADGDRIAVFASRDLFSYEAWRILDAAGEPVCSD